MKKVLSILLAVLMLLSCAGVAFAADKSVDVYVSVYDGSLLVPYVSLKVTDGLAEQYGYTMPAEDHNDEPIEQPTVFDALVAAHIYKYGADFTKAKAADYLVLSDYSYLTLAFGKAAGSSGFTVNGVAPYDDKLTEYAYGGVTYQSYTGYGINEARLADGDSVVLYFYQDTTYYSDSAAWFDCSVLTPEVTAGSDDVFLTLTGVGSFAFSYPGWEDQAAPFAGVDVYSKKDDGNFSKIGVTDENGQIVFHPKDAGEYTFTAFGNDANGTPVIPSFYTLIVKVQNQSFWQRIVSFFSKIINFFKNLFRFGN